MLKSTEISGASEMSYVVSVVIPVFRESPQLRITLDRLLRQDVSKEILVVIDQPTQNSLSLAEEFKRDVKFILNGERLGKSHALNLAIKNSKGEVLLFLDADVEIPEDKSFLRKVVEELEDVDLLDIKKEVLKQSFLSKMTYYEYAGFNIGSWLVTKLAKKSPSINGSAFAIRREVLESLGGFRQVVCEDMDLATRCFMGNYKVKYAKDLRVLSHVYSSWRKWLDQRKRWATGIALWLKNWYKPLLAASIKKPQIFLPALFFLYPSIIIVILYLLLPASLIYKLLSLALLFIALRLDIAFLAIPLTTLGTNFLKGIAASLTSFLASATTFYIFAKKLGFNFKLHEFFIYYHFYSLICLAITFAGLISVCVFNRQLSFDWKV
ncbi:MAG: hypothetical protein DRJ31_06555 [Candidatus Methanomethylicota archaeon]|uniref:Glycosyltransferase 2-like domain-containing protein n=1 Tax=Thermoproteota archaeon TaxID=2056631 RepID=A0A497EMX4_9CREN|nr:MAG: hypothetical protein DRJ31_06555 [Candidatus Verstraetearchaeota archaeon]